MKDEMRGLFKVSNGWKIFQWLEKKSSNGWKIFQWLEKTVTALFLILFIFVFCFSALAVEPEGMVSGRGRFYITGPNRGENLDVAIWAEDVSDKVAALLGEPFPHYVGDRMIHIQLSYPPDEPLLITNKVIRSAAGFVQILTLQQVTREHQDDALEQLVQLLFQRTIAQRTGFTDFESWITEIPAWLVRGAASHFMPSVRQANYEQVTKAWREGECVSLDLIQQGTLPSSLQDACEGEFFEWLLGRMDAQIFFDAVFKRLVEGKKITPEWLVDILPECSTQRKAAQLWDLYLATSQTRVVRPGGCTPRDIGALRKALLLTPEILSVSMRQEIVFSYRLNDLIAARAEPWMADLADLLSKRIQEVVIGRCAALQQVAEEYLAFLQALPAPHTDSDMNLRSLLTEAERSLVVLEMEMQSGQPAGTSSTF